MIGAGAGGLLWATRWGIGTSPDSAVYLGTAANLLVGRGLTVPIGGALDEALTRFPPLYPLVLAGIAALGVDLSQAARLVGAFAFAGLILVAAALPRKVAGAGAIAALLILVSPPLTLVQQMAWSEGLFLLLGFAGLLFLARAIDRKDRRWFWISVAAIALACLTRYAGIAFLLAGGSCLLLWGAAELGARSRRALTFTAAGGLPVLVWTTWTFAVEGGVGGREVGVHILGRAHIQQALGTVAGWLLLPVETPGWIKLAVLGVSTLVLLALALLPGVMGRGRQGWKPPSAASLPTVLRLLALTIAAYGLFLFLSISFLDANTPLDNRTLAPILVVLVIFAACAFGLAIGRSGRPTWSRVLGVLLLVFAAVLLGERSLDLINDAHAHGIGFGREEWRNSETISRVRYLPQTSPIYSDSPEAIYLLTGRAAYRLPRRYLLTSRKENDRYAAEMAEMMRRLSGKGGAIVDFDRVGAGVDPALTATQPVETIDTADGRIYEFGIGS